MAGYKYYNPAVRTQFGASSPNKSYWLLMTCDVLQGTRGKTYDEQQEVVEKYSGEGYVLPSGLEAATSILACYAQSDKREEHLSGKDPWTLTHCTSDQLVDEKWPLFVGGVGPARLYIDVTSHGSNFFGVVCCRRFLLRPWQFGVRECFPCILT
ncbi:MAG: hypothetical protein ACX93T_02890 [Bacteroidota bacterium]